LDELNKTDVNLGEEIRVRTLLGRDSNIVGRLPDGRIILFGKDNPYLNLLRENQTVNCHVVFVHEKHIICEPIGDPSPLQDSDQVVTDEVQEELSLEEFPRELALMEELERVSEQGYGDMAIIAKALLQIIRLQNHIIRRIDSYEGSR
jgi:hypothetical protein